MNSGGGDGSGLQQQVHGWRLCVFSSHLLPLPLCQEKGGLTCHMTGVTCHLYRVTLSQQRNADTETIRRS